MKIQYDRWAVQITRVDGSTSLATDEYGVAVFFSRQQACIFADELASYGVESRRKMRAVRVLVMIETYEKVRN